MKKKMCMAALMLALAMGISACGGSSGTQQKGAEAQTEAVTEAAAETEAVTEAVEEETWVDPTMDPADIPEDGTYQVTFHSDSSMFHLNETCEGKATLTVENGEMTVHVTLVSKNIVNLFRGSADEAKQEGACVIEPTLDEVTYSDGITEEVYGFDVPVPALDEEFPLALLGAKGRWYDHMVVVSSPLD